MKLSYQRPLWTRTIRPAWRSLPIVLVLGLALTATLPATVRAAPAVVGEPAGCTRYANLSEKLVLNSDGELTIPPLRAWQLPANPTWRENPFSDKYWLIRYQSLRYVEHLLAAWCADGDDALLERAAFLFRDWLADNPKGAAANWAWYDHPVAWRTFVFVRAASVMPAESWLRPAVAAHGSWLASYTGVGNHALNANRGLLQAGCFLGRQDWIDLAVGRMESLLRSSIDGQGVTNEQAIAYQQYNFTIYSAARDELLACGQPESEYFHRVVLMPNLLAHATLPNGDYEMLGNTFRMPALAVPGTPAEFTATRGESGQKPSSTDAIFRRGYAFVRSGWGENRPYEDEVMLSIRFGAGRAFHGHDEGGALTLYGLGSRLLLDSGKNSFQGAKPWTPFFLGRSAHNVVTVDGLTYRRSTSTTMSRVLGERSAFFLLGNGGYSGVSNTRSVLYSRQGRYVLVDDRLASTEYRTFRQLWHLAEDAKPLVDGNRVVTRGPNGNVQIIELSSGAATRVVTGRSSPTQGWLTYEYKKVVAAPSVERIRRGTSARYLTLLVPFRGSTDIKARIVQRWSDGYQVDVTIDGQTERVTVRGTTVSVKDVIVLPSEPTSPSEGEEDLVSGNTVSMLSVVSRSFLVA
ncbi:MAG: heparinase II/III-family protein [Chloroflexota bacterium]|nr:heparinase II/III-family protein [Chloroflexota bacterium]